MKLEPLTLEQCERVRLWRNAEMEVWRTSFMLTEEMQIDFYHQRICDRNSEHRYWAIREKVKAEDMAQAFIGMGGITYIQWENRIGEITLIINPVYRKDGYGEKAVDLLLDQAFNHLNLQTVFGECYGANEKGCSFWQSITVKYNGFTTALPNRKYWKGVYENSLYFSIDKEDFNAKHNSNK